MKERRDRGKSKMVRVKEDNLAYLDEVADKWDVRPSHIVNALTKQLKKSSSLRAQVKSHIENKFCG